MKEQEILDNAPKNKNHYFQLFGECKGANNGYINNSVGICRSLADIKRIAELEKKLSHAETMGGREQSIRDLEQRAKGVYDVRATTGFWNLSTCSLRTHLREYEVILKNQAKALKEPKT